jgi:NAD-dependent deacetylase
MGIEKKIEEAANILSKSRYAVAFTGAGISVESGIPPFRGKNGLWTKYDPKFLELSYYMSHTSESWKMIKKIFYDFIGKAKPNPAHYALAEMEKLKIIREIITQNIDNLHQSAGSNIVHEFHGNLKYFVCVDCFKRSENEKVDLNAEYPNCPNCGSLLKPDFIFLENPFQNLLARIALLLHKKLMFFWLLAPQVMYYQHVIYRVRQKQKELQ